MTTASKRKTAKDYVFKKSKQEQWRVKYKKTEFMYVSKGKIPMYKALPGDIKQVNRFN